MRFIKVILPCLLLCAVLLAVIFFPQERVAESAKQRVVTIWNIDTFEGGRGSRTSFLRKIARISEKKRKGVFFLVSSYTIEGAEEALAKGIKPDMISFGVGLSVFAEESIALPYTFSGGEFGGETRAIPWCMGGYSLYSLDDNFEDGGTTAVSVGGSNLSVLAARYAGIEGEEADSTAAYTGFLSGKYRYLLGTQRDANRFLSRGVTVYERKIEAYNDLFQYISILSLNNQDDARAFLGELLSKETAEALSEIGMSAVRTEGETRTLNVFTDTDSMTRIADLARTEQDIKNLDKFLKFI